MLMERTRLPNFFDEHQDRDPPTLEDISSPLDAFKADPESAAVHYSDVQTQYAEYNEKLRMAVMRLALPLC
jgi:hypothetical protein